MLTSGADGFRGERSHGSGMVKRAKFRKRRPLSKPVTNTMPSSTFQPKKADMEWEHGMLEASLEQMRQAFIRLVKVLCGSAG